MRKGFTLIEVIVAIGIFGLGVLAILTYFAISTQFVRLSRQTTIAANLAQQVVEENIASSYDLLTPGIGDRVGFAVDEADPYYPYEKRINISLIDENLAPSVTDEGLKKIEVFVYWTGVGGEKNVQMATIVSEK